MLSFLLLNNRRDQTLFLEGTKCLGAYLKRHFLSVDDEGLLLQVWLPHFFSVTLREANVVAELLTFAGNITYTHYLFLLYSRVYFSGFYFLSQ